MKDTFVKTLVAIAIVVAVFYFGNQEKDKPIEWFRQAAKREASASYPTPAPTPPPAKSNRLVESNQGVAYAFAKGFVEERLVSPSTAKFASHWDMKYEKVDARTWKIWSHVDSQNALGATVRTKFYAKVMYLGPSSWKLLDIKLK